jgi:hypothetical protein
MRTLAALALVLALTAPALASPLPGANASLSRIVPEAWETNDFVSLAEWQGYLQAIDAAYPDFVEVVEVGRSFGWPSLTGGHDTFPVYAVEITNEASATPREQKGVLLFQLSIHGNEKGGREGGFRVVEDLAAPLGWGQDARPLLDDLLLVFTFPNPDGWVHEEPQYRHNCPDYFAVGLPTGDCVETQNFVRFNGNGQDMNRDWPTLGWYNTAGGREHAWSEPEMAALGAYVQQFKGRTIAAADIHGMLNPADGGANNPAPVSDPLGLLAPGAGRPERCVPENPGGYECPTTPGHFVLGLMGTARGPAGGHRTVRLNTFIQEEMQAMADARFQAWSNAPNVGFAGGEWYGWGTGWETIGYTDSGSTGRWIPEGLEAPGGSFEMSYNHITFDNHYVPELNAMHVESVRAFVRAFLREAQEPRGVALDWEGTLAWVASGLEVAGTTPPTGAHANSTVEDAHEGPYVARPDAFWEDLAAAGPAGRLVRLTAQDVVQARWQGARAVAVSGPAWAALQGDAAAVQALQAFAAAGGTLFVTDEALQFLEASGLASAGSVEVGEAYLGHSDLDRSHPLAAGAQALAKQTYDGVSLGYRAGTNPVWTVAADAVRGMEVAGTTFGQDRASFGRVPLDQGEVVFLGALLPAPSAEDYVPYRLAGYAVTYHGHHLVQKVLGITLQETTTLPPSGAQGDAPARPAPGAEGALALLGLLGLALVARRKR